MQLDQSNGTLECRGKSKRLSTPSRSQTGDLLLCKCLRTKLMSVSLVNLQIGDCEWWCQSPFTLGTSGVSRTVEYQRQTKSTIFNYRNRISRSLTVPVGPSCPRRPTWRCRGAQPSAGVSAAGSRSCRPATPCAKFHSLQQKEIPGLRCQQHFESIGALASVHLGLKN